MWLTHVIATGNVITEGPINRLHCRQEGPGFMPSPAISRMYIFVRVKRSGRTGENLVTSDLLHKRLKPIYHHKTVFLLVFLLAFILIFPYFEQFRIGDGLLVVIMTGLLISAVFNVSDHPREVAITLLLLIPAALTSWAHFFITSREIFLVQIVSVIIFLVYTQGIILRRVMQTRHVTENEIFSAVSVYIMIGLAYVFAYQFIELVIPGSFVFGSGGSSFSSFMYFSFETLATVGFGDISVITPFARSVTILEMITGVMYLAIFVGVLVNAHYRFRDEAWDEETGAKREDKGHGLFRSGGPVSLDHYRGACRPCIRNHHESAPDSSLLQHVGYVACGYPQRVSGRCHGRHPV